MKQKPLTYSEGWAVVTWLGFIEPGTWGKPMDGMAIYRSKACALEQSRADQHCECPSRVVRVEIREVAPKKPKSRPPARRQGGARKE